MAQLYVDSFSIYATADIPTRWPGGTGGGIIGPPVTPPPGAQSGTTVFDATGTAAVYSTNYGNVSRYILGFQYYRNSTSGAGTVCGLMNAVSLSNNEASVVLQMSSTGTFITDGQQNTLATGPVVPYHEWNQFEIDFQQGLTGTANIYVYMNGNPTPFMSAVGVSTTYAVANYFFLGRPNQTNFPAFNQDNGQFASLYVFDGVGSIPRFNAPLAPQGLGNPVMAFGVANAPGAVSAWTPVGAGTVWQAIDQIPQDGDTTYAESSTVGQAYQCPFTALPTAASVISVQLSTYARQDAAGTRALQTGFYNGGTYGYSGNNLFLGSSYNYYEDEYMVNPVTGLAWTPASLSGMQYGAELTM
jgi:hypothetical protein